MKKKLLMSLLLLIAIGTSAVFAQKVGDTVKLSGKDYSVVEVRADGKVLLAITSLDGVWARDDKTEVITVSGNNATFKSYNPATALGKDAEAKSYAKVGDQRLRNLKSTGNLTWSGQILTFNFDGSKPDVATGTSWTNIELTMSVDGQTITVKGKAAGSASVAFTLTYKRQ